MVLMITIFGMCMVMHSATAVVYKVGGYNEEDSGNQQPSFNMNKKLFYHQKNKANNKKQQRHKAMMVFFEPMI